MKHIPLIIVAVLFCAVVAHAQDSAKKTTKATVGNLVIKADGLPIDTAARIQEGGSLSKAGMIRAGEAQHKTAIYQDTNSFFWRFAPTSGGKHDPNASFALGGTATSTPIKATIKAEIRVEKFMPVEDSAIITLTSAFGGGRVVITVIPEEAANEKTGPATAIQPGNWTPVSGELKFVAPDDNARYPLALVIRTFRSTATVDVRNIELSVVP